MPFSEIGKSSVRIRLPVSLELIEMIARKMWNIARQVYRIVVARVLRFPVLSQNGECGINTRPWVLLHNWIDDRSFDQDGIYRDVYFGILRDELKRRGVRVGIVAAVLRKAPYLRLLLRLKRSGIPVFIPESELSLRAVFKVALSLMTRLPPRRAWPRFEGFDVSEILNEVQQMDWKHTRLDDVLLISDVVHEWSRYLNVEAFI
jgi:hypothetical protein